MVKNQNLKPSQSCPGPPSLKTQCHPILDNKITIFTLVNTGASHSVIPLPPPLSPTSVSSYFSSSQTTDGSPMQILGEATLWITLSRLHPMIKVLVAHVYAMI